MTIKIEQIAVELFDKLRGRFSTISLGDEQAKNITDQKNARIFNFNYTDKDKTNYGNITVSLNNDVLKIYYGTNISDELSSDPETEESKKKQWYSFLQDLRVFARRNLLRFDVHDVSRNALELKDIKQVVATNEKYQQITPKVKLLIKENKSIFIVSGNNKIKCPTKNINECRVLARHVSSGGAMSDAFGTHICELIKESKLAKSIINNTKNTIDPFEIDLVESANARFIQLTGIIKMLGESRGFVEYKTKWASPTFKQIYEENSIMKKCKTLTRRIVETQSSYPKLKGIQREVVGFTQWANMLAEGTWNLPETDEEVGQLQKVMSQPLLAGIDGLDAWGAISDVISDDKLKSLLADVGKASPEIDVRPVIHDWLKQHLPEIADKVEVNITASEEPLEPELPDETGDAESEPENAEPPEELNTTEPDDLEHAHEHNARDDEVLDDNESEEEPETDENEPGLFKHGRRKHSTKPGTESSDLISIMQRLSGIK
jgi:hypothetical protein